jgi:release factor glutamine methyltransferase
MLKLVNNLTKKLLSVADNESQATFEVWLFLEKVTQQSRISLLARGYELSAAQQQELATMVAERVLENKPLAYILGDVPFAGISILVRPPILIPRPETEEMVLWIIETFKEYAHMPLVVLDMCTGSGCIALALAAAFPAWQLIGVDVNPAAIALAQENQRVLGLKNVKFEQGSLFDPGSWELPVDLVVSNPPYVNRAFLERVGSDVLKWEDHAALFAEHEGWAFYDALIDVAKRLMSNKTSIKPHVIMEFGVDQANMGQYLLDRGCESIEVKHDAAGLNRWAGCRI